MLARKADACDRLEVFVVLGEGVQLPLGEREQEIYNRTPR